MNTLKIVDIFKLASHEREHQNHVFESSLVISLAVAHGPQTIVGLTRTAFNAVHPSVKGRQLKQGSLKERQLPINSTENSFSQLGGRGWVTHCTDD